MPVLVLIVPTMTCRRCVRAVTARLRDLDGVETVQADASSGEVVVHGAVSEQDVRRALGEVGYPAAQAGTGRPPS